MGILFTKVRGNILTTLMGNVLTEGMGKVLDIYNYKEASQSGVLLTALTLGKPVIATNVGGLPEVVKAVQGGYIINSNDPYLLSKAINKASSLSGHDLFEWGKNIQRKTLKKYSWKNIARLTVNYYRKISR